MDREKLITEVLMLLPVLGRGVGRPSPIEMDALARRGIPVEVELAPGHGQVLISLALGLSGSGLISSSLGITVIGGLNTSTFLTLLVVPVAYSLLAGGRVRKKGRV